MLISTATVGKLMRGSSLKGAVVTRVTVGNRYEKLGARLVRPDWLRAYSATIRDEGHREEQGVQADPFDELRARASSWPPLRSARLRCERGSIGVVSPTVPFQMTRKGEPMRRVIGMDIHRTFAKVVFWEDGRLHYHGRIDRDLVSRGSATLLATDEIFVEATGNAMAAVRVLSPFVARVVVANPMQVKAIAHARFKTDRIDACVQGHLHARGLLPEVWIPGARTERLRRLVLGTKRTAPILTRKGKSYWTPTSCLTPVRVSTTGPDVAALSAIRVRLARTSLVINQTFD